MDQIGMHRTTSVVERLTRNLSLLTKPKSYAEQRTLPTSPSWTSRRIWNLPSLRKKLSHYNSTLNFNKRINPFSAIPFFPTSSEGSPTLAFNSLYGKEFGGAQVTNSAFFFWDDDGPTHMRRHTCVFVCPGPYERFPAGRQGNSEKFTLDKNSGLVWYTQKKLAEHGAAARRSDCYYYRKCCELNPEAEPVKNWGLDIPYNEGEGIGGG
jgi:hypothetical protein